MKDKYQTEIIKILKKTLKNNSKAFIFGSSVNSEQFDDIDIGILGKSINEKDIRTLKETFSESNIPYKIDIIHFDKTERAFQDKVFENKIIWLT